MIGTIVRAGPAPCALALLGMLLVTPQSLVVMAADRSVTIIEGVEEPGNASSAPAVTPAPPVTPLPPLGDAAPTSGFRTDNPAGVKLSILPGNALHLGAKVSFSVSADRPGYLVLVDLNTEGKLTQIYPNMLSLSRSSGDVTTGNLLKPGSTVTIPNGKNPLARFVFTADPPAGNGAIVAILSENPVQIIDLPETPATPVSAQASIDALSTSVSGLKIVSSNSAGKFSQGSWSFAAAPYAIGQ